MFEVDNTLWVVIFDSLLASKREPFGCESCNWNDSFVIVLLIWREFTPLFFIDIGK